MKLPFRDSHFVEALYVAFLGFCLVALSSCSHHNQLEKKVDQEAQAEPALEPGPELAKASEEVIFDAPSLKPAQRQKLKELHERATSQMRKIRGEIGQNQLVLVKNLVNPKVGDDKIKIARQRILDLEKERTALWMNNLDEAKKILGRRTESDERLYRAFVLTEPTGVPAVRSEIQ